MTLSSLMTFALACALCMLAALNAFASPLRDGEPAYHKGQYDASSSVQMQRMDAERSSPFAELCIARATHDPDRLGNKTLCQGA